MIPLPTRLLLAAALATALSAWGQTAKPTVGAPSDEPVPAQEVSASHEDNDKPSRLKGFDVELSLVDSSGVYFAAEAYSQSLSLTVEPSYAFGKQWFKGGWAEKLSAHLRLPVEMELTGNDSRFRGRSFASPSLYDFPEQVVIDDTAQVTTTGQVEGLAHRPVLLGDIWLGVSHGNLATVPVVGIELSGSLRAVIPTSISSLNSGLISTVSVGLNAERTFGPMTLSYGFRPAKYFYSRSSPRPVPLTETVLINGRETTLWRPDSTGDTLPNFGFSHSFDVTAKLPRGFSLNASYVFSQVAPLPLSGCQVAGIPTADVCRDGPRVSDLRGSVWRLDHWFSAGAEFEWRALTFALGLSTYRPLHNLDGSLSQPFWSSNRNNYTTLYVSVASSLSAVFDTLSPP